MLVSFRVSCDGESRWDNFFAWQTGGLVAHEAELNHAILGASISIERVAIITRLANDYTITAFVLAFILLVKDEAGINEFAFHALVKLVNLKASGALHTVVIIWPYTLLASVVAVRALS